jgi:hypothetical protein
MSAVCVRRTIANKSRGVGAELSYNSHAGATKRAAAIPVAEIRSSGKLTSPRPKKSKIRQEIEFLFFKGTGSVGSE